MFKLIVEFHDCTKAEFINCRWYFHSQQPFTYIEIEHDELGLSKTFIPFSSIKFFNSTVEDNHVQTET